MPLLLLVPLLAVLLAAATLPGRTFTRTLARPSTAHRQAQLRPSRPTGSSMLGWMGWSGKKERAQASPHEKLRGYHDLARDALEQAYQADVSGGRDRAIKLYRMALQALDEGMQLPVQPTGLGYADNISQWKQDMQGWQGSAAARLRYLESGATSTSAPEPVKPVANTSGLKAATTSTQPNTQPNTSAGGARHNTRQTQQQGQQGSQSVPWQQQLRRRTSGSDGGAQRQNSRVGAAGARIPQAAAAGGRVSPSQGRGAEEDRYRQMILSEILDHSPQVSWENIAGLQVAKQALQEAVVLPSLRPDLFSGPLRAPIRGILLYGPPGNGKTLLGKALAHEAKARFFAISASSLTSKWVGEGEKLVRTLFTVAAEQAPSIIFIDEIDSILGSRGGANEGDAARRLKTEFLIQFDGVASQNNDRVVVIGATNRPYDIDEAVRRRLVKRIYIPLPADEGRLAVLQKLLSGQQSALSSRDLAKVVKATDGYSASDLTALCKEAAMGPLRELPPSALVKVAPGSLRPISLQDFANALSVIKPSCNKEMLKGYEDFTREFGTQA